MKIISATLFDHEALLSRLRDTPLRGFEGQKIYAGEAISMVVKPFHGLDAEHSGVGVAQRYVLRQGVGAIISLKHSFYQEYGFDLFEVRGFVRITTKENPALVRDFLPPIIEWSEPDNSWVLNDGMHRLAAAAELSADINCVWIRGVPADRPYYAVPRKGKETWDISIVSEAPPEGAEGGRKEYRHPENYRDYYRNFNAHFENVSIKR